MPKKEPKIENEDYLKEELQKVDPDRYLISLFAPKGRRESLWALFLFNHEISKTRFVVTETQLGLIRMQWWRDEITKLYEGKSAPDHPVLKGLEIAIRDFSLPKALFDNMIFAREFDLEDVTPQGIEGLINYADLTTTPLNKLAIQIAGDDPSEHSVQKISIRYSLIKLFLLIPEYQKSRFTIIPTSLYEEVQSYLMQREKIELYSPLLKAQNTLTKLYVKQLSSVQFDPNDPKLKKPPLFKELRVALSVSFP